MPSDYHRVEKAIRYIEKHALEHPGLQEVSSHVGLSQGHFQKMFRRLTGLSPKRYLQFLTIQDAKRLLSGSASVLETSCEVGLSGPGRLHDLFVSVETVTPGQYKSGGAGMTLEYGFHQTPFGKALLAVNRGGVTDLQFITEEEKALSGLNHRWPSADIIERPEATASLLDRIFGDPREGEAQIPLILRLRGTNLQIKVWQALLHIPEGAVVSYTDVARMAGRPGAVRAVANAVGRNPVAWVIPCHRVLRRSGEMGGYRWGVTRKKMMLAREIGGQED